MGDSCNCNNDQRVISVNGQVMNGIGKIVMKVLIAGFQARQREIQK